MPLDLTNVLEPATTAVLTMELQRGVTGDLAAMADLARQVAAAGVIDNAARLCRAARAAGATVVHCTAAYRIDGRGSKVNSRIQAAAIKLNQGRLNVDQPGVEIMPEIGPEPGDIEVMRFHGLTPFTSTSLDQILRNLGITTVVGLGNSVNVGIIGMALTAVDLGYQVVIPRDGVAGVPREYADAVLEHSLAMLATVCSTDDIVAAWKG